MGDAPEGGGGLGPDRVAAGGIEDVPRGALLDRFVVLDRLGSGGMGVVYSALDPDLDRRVAVKLLRTAEGAPGEPGGDRARLLREGQALARLSHPNVTAVYQVGTVGDRVFIAMELVDGETLTSWLRRERRSWRQVLSVFSQAGEGLAAAHRAGLVHRDFKPDNVLLGKDGRVRVTDFGLARPVGDRALRDVAAGPPIPGVCVPAGAPTETAAFAGTPGYMAPEQHLGRPADGRSDLFSFCVALYEAVYGERPFGVPESGLTERSALALEALAGRVRSAPEGSAVPAWLRGVLLRGLQAAPEERFPSMEELLAALGRDPALRRRRWLGMALVAALLAATAFGVREWQRNRAALCTGAAEKLAEVLGPEREARIEAAFHRTQAPYASQVWQSTRAALRRHGEAWAAGYGDACRATRVRGEQSEHALDLRMQCLEHQRQELAALVALLAEADLKVVQQSVQAASALTPPSRCSDVATLAQVVAPPRDPQAAAAAASVRGALAEVKALRDAGKHREALPRAQAQADAARALGYAPLEGQALLLLGDLQQLTGDGAASERSLYRAAAAADQARDDETRARAWIALVWVVGYKLARPVEGQAFAEVAMAAVRRLGGGELLEADLASNLGAVHYLQADHEQARREFERALAIRRRLLGPQDTTVASALTRLASERSVEGHTGEVQALNREALAIRVRTLGAEHPDSVSVLFNMGAEYQRNDGYQEALGIYRRVLEIRERTLGADHPDVAQTLNNLANTLLATGKLDEALPYHERALAIRERRLGGEHPDVAESLNNLGRLLGLMGRLGPARAAVERSLAIREKVFGPRHPRVGTALNNLAWLALRAGHLREAEALFQKALATFAGDLQAPNLIEVYAGLGRAQLAAGRLAEAEKSLAEALRREPKDSVGWTSPAEMARLLERARAGLRAGQPGH